MTHQSTDNLEGPAYPLTPGGRVPQLNLAGADGFDVASGQSFQSMPNPVAPAPVSFPLQGSPAMGGIDPETPLPDLNLAGVGGVPSPEQLTQSAEVSIHQPDFGLPDFVQPNLQPYDLTEPGITQAQNPLFTPDPFLPDLAEYRHPYGLTFHDQDAEEILKPDLMLDELLDYDAPQGMLMRRDGQSSDPLLPDLQEPELTQAVHMQQRPGDLALDAAGQVHSNPGYDTLDDVPYGQVFMDQAGMNSTRRRHYDLLLTLYREE